MLNELLNKVESQMKKSMDVFQHELSKMRTGQASLSILDDIKVDYYGTMTPLNQMATLAAPDPRTLTVQPWDKSVLSLIEKTLQKSDLGLNPANDGSLIRLPIPSLNEERRKSLVKSARKHGEDSKIAVRNIRRDANDKIKVLKKDSDITEDDEKKSMSEVQDLTNQFIKKIDDLLGHKEKDIMKV